MGVPTVEEAGDFEGALNAFRRALEEEELEETRLTEDIHADGDASTGKAIAPEAEVDAELELGDSQHTVLEDWDVETGEDEWCSEQDGMEFSTLGLDLDEEEPGILALATDAEPSADALKPATDDTVDRTSGCQIATLDMNKKAVLIAPATCNEGGSSTPDMRCEVEDHTALYSSEAVHALTCRKDQIEVIGSAISETQGRVQSDECRVRLDVKADRIDHVMEAPQGNMYAKFAVHEEQNEGPSVQSEEELPLIGRRRVLQGDLTSLEGLSREEKLDSVALVAIAQPSPSMGSQVGLERAPDGHLMTHTERTLEQVSPRQWELDSEVHLLKSALQLDSKPRLVVNNEGVEDFVRSTALFEVTSSAISEEAVRRIASPCDDDEKSGSAHTGCELQDYRAPTSSSTAQRRDFEEADEVTVTEVSEVQGLAGPEACQVGSHSEADGKDDMMGTTTDKSNGRIALGEEQDECGSVQVKALPDIAAGDVLMTDSGRPSKQDFGRLSRVDFEEKPDGFAPVVDVKSRLDVFEVAVEDPRHEASGSGIASLLKSEKTFSTPPALRADDKEGDTLRIGGDVEDHSTPSLGTVDLCSRENEHIKLKLVTMPEVLEVQDVVELGRWQAGAHVRAERTDEMMKATAVNRSTVNADDEKGNGSSCEENETELNIGPADHLLTDMGEAPQQDFARSSKLDLENEPGSFAPVADIKPNPAVVVAALQDATHGTCSKTQVVVTSEESGTPLVDHDVQHRSAPPCLGWVHVGTYEENQNTAIVSQVMEMQDPIGSGGCEGRPPVGEVGTDDLMEATPGKPNRTNGVGVEEKESIGVGSEVELEGASTDAVMEDTGKTSLQDSARMLGSEVEEEPDSFTPGADAEPSPAWKPNWTNGVGVEEKESTGVGSEVKLEGAITDAETEDTGKTSLQDYARMSGSEVEKKTDSFTLGADAEPSPAVVEAAEVSMDQASVSETPSPDKDVSFVATPGGSDMESDTLYMGCKAHDLCESRSSQMVHSHYYRALNNLNVPESSDTQGVEDLKECQTGESLGVEAVDDRMRGSPDKPHVVSGDVDMRKNCTGAKSGVELRFTPSDRILGDKETVSHRHVRLSGLNNEEDVSDHEKGQDQMSVVELSGPYDLEKIEYQVERYDGNQDSEEPVGATVSPNVNAYGEAQTKITGSEHGADVQSVPDDHFLVDDEKGSQQGSRRFDELAKAAVLRTVFGDMDDTAVSVDTDNGQNSSSSEADRVYPIDHPEYDECDRQSGEAPNSLVPNIEPGSSGNLSVSGTNGDMETGPTALEGSAIFSSCLVDAKDSMNSTISNFSVGRMFLQQSDDLLRSNSGFGEPQTDCILNSVEAGSACQKVQVCRVPSLPALGGENNAPNSTTSNLSAQALSVYYPDDMVFRGSPDADAQLTGCIMDSPQVAQPRPPSQKYIRACRAASQSASKGGEVRSSDSIMSSTEVTVDVGLPQYDNIEVRQNSPQPVRCGDEILDRLPAEESQGEVTLLTSCRECEAPRTSTVHRLQDVHQDGRVGSCLFPAGLGTDDPSPQRISIKEAESFSAADCLVATSKSHPWHGQEAGDNSCDMDLSLSVGLQDNRTSRKSTMLLQDCSCAPRFDRVISRSMMDEQLLGEADSHTQLSLHVGSANGSCRRPSLRSLPRCSVATTDEILIQNKSSELYMQLSASAESTDITDMVNREVIPAILSGSEPFSEEEAIEDGAEGESTVVLKLRTTPVTGKTAGEGISCTGKGASGGNFDCTFDPLPVYSGAEGGNVANEEISVASMKQGTRDVDLPGEGKVAVSSDVLRLAFPSGSYISSVTEYASILPSIEQDKTESLSKADETLDATDAFTDTSTHSKLQNLFSDVGACETERGSNQCVVHHQVKTVAKLALFSSVSTDVNKQSLEEGEPGMDVPRYLGTPKSQSEAAPNSASISGAMVPPKRVSDAENILADLISPQDNLAISSASQDSLSNNPTQNLGVHATLNSECPSIARNINCEAPAMTVGDNGGFEGSNIGRKLPSSGLLLAAEDFRKEQSISSDSAEFRDGTAGSGGASWARLNEEEPTVGNTRVYSELRAVMDLAKAQRSPYERITPRFQSDEFPCLSGGNALGETPSHPAGNIGKVGKQACVKAVSRIEDSTQALHISAGDMGGRGGGDSNFDSESLFVDLCLPMASGQGSRHMQLAVDEEAVSADIQEDGMLSALSRQETSSAQNVFHEEGLPAEGCPTSSAGLPTSNVTNSAAAIAFYPASTVQAVGQITEALSIGLNALDASSGSKLNGRKRGAAVQTYRPRKKVAKDAAAPVVNGKDVPQPTRATRKRSAKDAQVPGIVGSGMGSVEHQLPLGIRAPPMDLNWNPIETANVQEKPKVRLKVLARKGAQGLKSQGQRNRPAMPPVSHSSDLAQSAVIHTAAHPSHSTFYPQPTPVWPMGLVDPGVAAVGTSLVRATEAQGPTFDIQAAPPPVDRLGTRMLEGSRVQSASRPRHNMAPPAHCLPPPTLGSPLAASVEAVHPTSNHTAPQEVKKPSKRKPRRKAQPLALDAEFPAADGNEPAGANGRRKRQTRGNGGAKGSEAAGADGRRKRQKQATGDVESPKADGNESAGADGRQKRQKRATGERNFSQQQQDILRVRSIISRRLEAWGSHSNLLQVPPEGGDMHIVFDDEQREEFVQKMVTGCQANPRLRDLFLGAVRQLAQYGVFKSAASQSPSEASDEVVTAWEQMKLQPGACPDPLNKMLKAVDKLHRESEIAGDELQDQEFGLLSRTPDAKWDLRIPQVVGKAPAARTIRKAVGRNKATPAAPSDASGRSELERTVG